MNIFKDQVISRKGFILITIFAIIVGASMFFYFYKKQDKKDMEFEKSREGIQKFIDSQNNASTSTEQ